MKYTLLRNYAGVSENLQLEILCQLDRCFFFHQTPFPLQIRYSIHSLYFAEQDAMSLSPRTDILAEKTDTVNYTMKCFHLDTAVQNILQIIWGPNWFNMLEKLSKRMSPLGRNNLVKKSFASRENRLSNCLEVGRSI